MIPPLERIIHKMNLDTKTSQAEAESFFPLEGQKTGRQRPNEEVEEEVFKEEPRTRGAVTKEAAEGVPSAPENR